jgi:hypothetical protein
MVQWNARFLSFQKGGMMSKRFSRRATRSFAVACLTLAVVCLGGAKFADSALFSSTQYQVISGASANLSSFCIYNVNTGSFGCYPATFGTYVWSYPFPFNAYYVFYLYDHNQARFAEAIIIQDVPL